MATEASIVPEGHIQSNPTMHLSQDLTRTLVNNGVRLLPYVSNPAWNPDDHNRLAYSSMPGANLLVVSANRFTRELSEAIAADHGPLSTQLKQTVERALYVELGEPRNPIEPSHALREDFRKYYQFVKASKHSHPSREDIQHMGDVRRQIEARLSLFAGLQYYQEYAPNMSKLDLRINKYIPDAQTLQEYYDLLTNFDHNNPYLDTSFRQQLTLPAMPLVDIHAHAPTVLQRQLAQTQPPIPTYQTPLKPTDRDALAATFGMLPWTD